MVIGVFFSPTGGAWLSELEFSIVGESASVPALVVSSVLLLPLRTLESRNEGNREMEPEQLKDEMRGDGGRRESKKNSIVLIKS